MLAFRSLAGTLVYRIFILLTRVVAAAAYFLDCRCKCVSGLGGFLTESSNDDTELLQLNVKTLGDLHCTHTSC